MQTYRIRGLDCAEEVAILKRVLAPMLGGESQLQFDILNGKIILDASRSPGAYLRRSAVNASIDLLRRKKSRPETEIDERVDHTGRAGLRLAESEESALLLKERLRAALARLSAEHAELFVLCYLEGYSYDELADMLQMERGTVGSRLHRIRAALQEDLND